MNPLSNLTLTSSDADLDRLQQVCEQLSGFDERVSIEWLDGAMTALACGPRPPKSVDGWKAGLFGDTWSRVFADPASDAEATAVLQARWNVLLRQLDPEALYDAVDELRLAPVLLDWSEEPAAAAEGAKAPAGEGEGAKEGEASSDEAPPRTGELWAHGFLDVVDRFPEDWPEPDVETELGEAFDHATTRIAMLVMPEDDEEYRSLLAEFYPDETPTRDDLVHEALFSAQDIRVYWVENAPKPETRRVEKTPGRNDPCPCGSGKKYKKCHGAG